MKPSAKTIGRILAALYGKDYVYRAPELFEPGHRALIFVAAGRADLLERLADEVEEKRRKFDNRTNNKEGDTQ